MSKSISLSNKFVAFKNNQLVTTSLKVAEYFEKRHADVMRDIRLIADDIDQRNFAQMFFTAAYPDKYGRPQPMYLLNRDGFLFLVTGFTGKKAAQVKLNFIKAFNAMEQKLSSMSQDEIKRRILREQSKVTRHEFTDSIKPFVDREKPANPNLYYSAPTSFIQNHLCGIPNGGRDSATGEQLAMLIVLEGAGKRTFNQADDRGDQFEQAYTDVRNATTRLKQYINGEISLLN